MKKKKERKCPVWRVAQLCECFLTENSIAPYKSEQKVLAKFKDHKRFKFCCAYDIEFTIPWGNIDDLF